jgi:pyruvate/2-oxoglutarate dehydrogenase complex dihydrolipoamide dehydrogenase (E3) component
VAAKRGHDVHVYEKRKELGGQLVPGSMPGHKSELRSLIQFLTKQAALFGVQCHLNYEVTAEDIQAIRPDLVILATGSLPLLPEVEGIENDIALTYEDVLNNEPAGFKNVVVVGGGPTGLELALFMSERGCTVTVIEILPKAGKGLEAMTKKIILSRLKRNRAVILTSTRLLKIEGNGVKVADPDGLDRFIEADKVLVAIGTRPNNQLYDRIKSLGIEIHQIGDCLEPRSAKDAIYESAVLGRKI